MDDLLSAFGNIALDNHDALCSTFVRVLRTDANVARFFLESAIGDVGAVTIGGPPSSGSYRGPARPHPEDN